MTLPSSGEISLGDINVEKGDSRTAADTSLESESTTNINTDSEDHPDQTAPHAISEFYGYDHDASGEPAQPQNLSANTVSSTQIDLSWDDVADEDEYRIERSTDGGSTWSQIDTVGADVTSYSDTGLTEGKTYHYRIRACNTDGCSAYSNTASDTTTLPAPTSLSSPSHDADSVDLTWTDNATDETGYEVQYKKSADSTWSSKSLSANTTSTTIFSLASDTQYDFRVRALGEDTNSSWSSTIQVTTDQLSAPSITVHTISTSQLDVLWSAVNGADHYEVEHSTDGSTWSSEATPSTSDYSDTGLTEATRHYYRVRTVDSDGNTSPWSNVDDNFTQPAAPSSLAANADSSIQITVTWTENSNNEDGIELERDQGGDGSWEDTFDLSPDTEEYIDGGLNSGTQYCYRTRAYVTHPSDGKVYSDYSNTSCATTDEGGGV